MKLTAGWLAAVCVVALPWPCRAQPKRLSFGHLSVEDGLSNAWVQSILKDSRGFLWFGTQDGLNRYDGGSIRVYRHDPLDAHSLPSSVAMALLEDSKKRLWVGSGWGNAGVALYDREHDRFTRFLPSPGQAVGNDVRVMFEDGQGRLWLGTDGGVARLDPESGRITRFPLVLDGRVTPQTRIIALFEDRQRRFWVGSSTGLLQLDREHGRYARWPASGDDPTGLRRAQIEAFYEAEDGAIWIATLGEGLQRAEAGTDRVTRYLPDDRRDPESGRHARVRRLVPDGKGRLYVATETEGFHILDLATRKLTRVSPSPEEETGLRSGSIWSMHLDDQGMLWLGTYDSGVEYMSPFAQRFEALGEPRAKRSSPHVGAVIEDHRGRLWIGTDGGGLRRLDRKTGTFTYYRHDPRDRTTIGSNAVWALLEDSQRNVWVGGWDGGLGRLDRASDRFTRFRHDPREPKSIANDNVWHILELHTGELLVVTQGGADLFDRKSGVFTRLTERYPGAGEGVLFSAAEDSAGNLWIVGDVFVGHVDRRTGQITRYRHDPRDPKSLGAGWTQAVRVDSVGNVWLGTQGGLSCVAANTKELRRYTAADGLPDNTINSMSEDGAGNLWLGTNRGLSKLVDAIHLPDKPTFVNFDVHDGLPGSGFARNAAWRGKDGEMFFGGARGLSVFDPQHIRQNPQAPPVVLTGLKILNSPAGIGTPGSPLVRTITETSELTLLYRHSMVTFEFAALDFAVPQKNRYAYKLEGFDGAWNEVGTQRSATYTNLPAGTFTLRVRGSNNDGVWNEEGVSLKIRVTPPWWRTRWFLATIVLGFLGAVAGAYALRVRQHLRVERRLRERVAAALADVKTLRGLLPICAWCKKVRDDKGYWSRIEEYVSEHSQAAFSHGICPECRDKQSREEQSRPD